MKVTKRMKKAVSSLLALSLVLSYVPLPTLAEEGCTHHVHDESCGYVEGAACTFDPAACEQCNVLGNQSADWCGNPLCSQEDNAHAPACDQYVRTYEGCKCVLSCAEEGLNDWCETCFFEGVDACTGGKEEQTAYAVIEGYTGQCNWTFDEESSTLTISGNGTMDSNQPWSSYNTEITTVEIEPGVLNIGNYAFYNCKNLTSVTIPNSVTTIGNYAFTGCTSLESVTIPASVTNIGSSAFYGCSSLTTVLYYGENPPTPGRNVFVGSGIITVSVPEDYVDDKFCGVDVEKRPGSSTPEPTTYTVTFHLNGYGTAIPQQTVTENGKVGKPEDPTAEGYIFAGWYADQELTTEWNFETNTVTDNTDLYAKWTVTCEHDWDTYTGICDYCSENHGDHKYTWTDGACSVCGVVGGYCGYTGDETLVEYVLTSENEGITYTITISGTGKMGEYNAVNQPWSSYCGSITTAVVNSGVQDVGWGAFKNHTALTSVSIPDSITKIGSMAFYGTTNLRSVTLPSALTSLGSNAFYNSGIRSITIPAGVTQIQYNTFQNSKLSSINLGNVTTIGTNAFRDCKQLTSITLPNTLTTIGTDAFNGSNLTSVTIPPSVTEIGASAFQGCNALKTVSISGDDLEVMKQAFCYNNALETLTITNAGAVSLGQRAFGIQQNTTDKLDSINLSDTVTLYNNSYADVFEYRRTPVTGVSLDKTEMTVYIGNSEKLTATVEPGTATNKKVTWSSSDNNIATVDTEGNVTGVAGGTAIITVTTADGSKTATCTVTVPAHTHNWTYTAKGATITATCGEANCPVSEGKVTITLNTPEDLTYNSTAKSVTVTQNPEDVFTDIPAVTYEGNRIDAGRHTASLTYGEKTATLTFTIEKATISSVTVDVTAPAAGAAPQFTVTGGTGYSAAIAWTPRVEKFGFNTVYTATVTLTPDGNHQFDNGIIVEDWDLSNSEGILTLTRTFNATRMETLTDVALPEDQKLTVYCADADAVIAKLPASVTYTTETGGTKTAEIQWTCTDYNPAPKAENTFNWVANSVELTGYDVNGQVTSGSVKVTNVDATPVKITASNLEIVYSGETYDVAKLFTIDENAGAASYTITEKTGEGSLAGSVLTVTKAGTFTIELNTTANDPYDSGKAIAVLTVTKGSGSGSVTMEGWTYGETAKTPVPASETNGTDNVTYQYKVKDANDAAYGNEKPTNAGTYTVKATFAANDLYAETTAAADFTIAKATYDMSGAKWDYTEAFAYDGMEHTVAVSGLPTGVTVGGYTGNTATTVGEYTAAVILSYDEENYNEPTIADLNWAIVNDWEPTEFTFTALNGNGYSNTDFVVTAAEGYSISTTNTADGTWAASLTKSEETAEGEVTFYLKNNATGAISLAKTLSYKLDKTNPTGKVEFVERSSWEKFVNDITFGLFYKTEVTVKAEAADTLSGVETIEYAASNKSMTLDEVEAITSWQAMPENGVSVALEDAKKFVYFVKITDKAGNVTYLSTNGAEYDTTAPVIGGIENGAVYYTTQTATVTEKNLDVLTLNGTATGTTIALEGNKKATYTIVAKDKAGNETTTTVTMKPIATLAEPVANLNKNNATSEHRETIETVLEKVETVLKADGIPAAEKAALEEIQTSCQEMLKVIADAAAAIDTEDIRKAADKNAANVKLQDKDDLKKAKTALEEALEKYEGNYTQQEKTAIRKEIERLGKAIETIEQTEAVIAAIKALPKSVEPDLDEKTEKAIREAKAAYDKLNDYQKSLMDKDDQDKLEKLIDSLDDYEIIKGSGKKWEKGSGQSLQFTANGPVRKFKELRIDDKVVGASNYTIQEGSTILTLKASYLQTLSNGKHTIQFVYTDGETDGKDTFQICQSAGNPGTGDNNHMMMLTGIMMTSLLCMAAMVMLAPWKKGKYEQ